MGMGHLKIDIAPLHENTRHIYYFKMFEEFIIFSNIVDDWDFPILPCLE